MQVDLKNQVALVTGAARGIGQAIGQTLAANGARVVFADVDEAGARDAANGVANAFGLRLDVSDEGEVERGVARVLERCGRLDILVNNAGVNTMKNRVTIDEFSLEEWNRVLSVDLTGLFLMSRAGARPMLGQGSGRIINIGSVVGLVPLRLQCAFAAAKAGVTNLTKAMAIELGGRGVLCNAIAPGSILTPGTRALFYGEDGQYSQSAGQLLAHIPLGRPGTPAEIAHAALFLAAPASSYINGHVLTVDGGWTAGYAREF